MTRGNDPSLADIYREVGQIHTKLDLFIDRADQDREAAEQRHNGIAGRVRKLERWRSYVVGLVGGAGAVLGYAFGTHK
jgi:hypothetical protein